MRRFSMIQWWTAFAASCMLMVWSPAAWAAEASPRAAQPTPRVHPSQGSPIRLAAREPKGKAPLACDVRLTDKGTLQGVAVNMDGIPLSESPVSLYQGTRELGAGETDRLGRFSFGPLSPGTYHLVIRDHVLVVRTWQHQTAPPNAKPAVLVVIGDRTSRGQRPIGKLLNPDVVVLGALVAAAIAIPLAVSDDDSSPISP